MPPSVCHNSSPRVLKSNACRPGRQLNHCRGLLPGHSVIHILGRTNTVCRASSGDEFTLFLERGLEFTPGNAFYRSESAQGRDLAMLAAAVYKKSTGRLRVLDAMSGCGVRGARYFEQAGADEVWCNDFNPTNQEALVYNLCSAAGLKVSEDHRAPPAQALQGQAQALLNPEPPAPPP
eukprot:gene14039-19976_t